MTKTSVLTVRIDPNTKNVIQILAARDGRTASNLINRIVAEYITNHPVAEPSQEDRVRARIGSMGFTVEQESFIWSDWPNWDEHIAWLLTATRREILDWIAAGQ